MLERESNYVPQPLESSCRLTIMNALSNNNLDPSHILCGISPYLCEQFFMEWREAKLVMVAFVSF